MSSALTGLSHTASALRFELRRVPWLLLLLTTPCPTSLPGSFFGPECILAAARNGSIDVLDWADSRHSGGHYPPGVALSFARTDATLGNQVQAAARAHARRLFELLGMDEVDEDTR